MNLILHRVDSLICTPKKIAIIFDHACEGIVLPDAQVIRGFEEGDGYKYLGILEAGDVKHNDMKQSISKEYLRRIRKIL